MEFSGERVTIFLSPQLPDTVPVNRLVAMGLDEVNMKSESKEYLDKTDRDRVAQTRIPTISEENNPNGIWCPSGAGWNLVSGASGSTSRVLEELRCRLEQGSTRCFFHFVEWNLKRAGMTTAAEEYKKRTEAKTPTEVEEFGSVKLWNHLNMPFHMLMEMVRRRFTVSPSPVVFLPPVTASFVTPQPGWTPASSGLNPVIGVEIEGPMEAAPKPNQGLFSVFADKPKIYSADFSEEVKAERAAAAAAAEAEGSGGKRKAGADVGELSVLKKKKGRTDSAEVSSSEISP